MTHKKIEDLLSLDTNELQNRIADMSEEEFALLYTELSILMLQDWDKAKKIMKTLRRKNQQEKK
ncbi:hypothetical protein FTV88_2745 [Heliorestis convoluta]|uniref:Uncharacterized protein n=2 Tax=Heliorestis convoluta TaxID=356322 RepID=A0A5Q2N0J8_9FIRM|nr:hypothetical protein FTV88_2745 [Heliorestis convoluta]